MLKRESLLGLRTSQNVRSSLAAARRGAPTLHERQGLEEAVTPQVPAGLLDRLLAAERARLVRQEESIRRSQEKLLQIRCKLKSRKYVNEQLSAMRRELMAGRVSGAPSPAAGAGPKPTACRSLVPEQVLPLRY